MQAHLILVWPFHPCWNRSIPKPIHLQSSIVNFHCRSHLLESLVTETLVYRKTTSRRFHRLRFGTLNYITIYFWERNENDFCEIKCYFKRIKLDFGGRGEGALMVITQYIGKALSVKRQASGIKLPYEFENCDPRLYKMVNLFMGKIDDANLNGLP